MAKHDKMALGGFLNSLGCRLFEEKLIKIKKLEEAAEEMKERITTLEEFQTRQTEVDRI